MNEEKTLDEAINEFIIACYNAGLTAEDILTRFSELKAVENGENENNVKV